MPASSPTPREFAALMYALGLARGQLTSVEMEHYEPTQLSQISRSTSLTNIAAALGLKEGDLAVDPNEYLTQAEMDKIAGRR